ncbi:diaminopimelate epimerase [Amycolatopsis sp. WQ 127309]|uniref:diaminopimelate epimerase n=1 Tax=Amycolatopsis sp. WQ 127309 TaxID=2932773 RepID=UPI001FF3C40D|nr:diaminopimelate epimerase [Amycolatopsis sp. WQ 127309]UOZ06903.1 diaminopimelate epimerase [Amycolatopsis sp. WQ 127309]
MTLLNPVRVPTPVNLHDEVDAAVGALPGRLRAEVDKCALLHGNGNIIAIVELSGREDDPAELLRTGAVVLSDSVTSARIDGVLFFYPRHVRGPRMKFFDRDGTPELMCGNGLRCVARYAVDRGLMPSWSVVVTDDGVKRVRVTDEYTEVAIGDPREVQKLADDLWFVFTGVPHLVVLADGVAAVDEVDVATRGAQLSRDPELCARLGYPGGLHVNFAAVQDRSLVIRTYEVGVEDETQCCGTGATATAYVGWCAGLVSLPVTLRTRGGEVSVAQRSYGLTLAGPVGYLTEPRRPARRLPIQSEA